MNQATRAAHEARWAENARLRAAYDREYLDRCKAPLIAAGIDEDYIEYTTFDGVTALRVYLTVKLDGEGGGIFYALLTVDTEGLAMMPAPVDSGMAGNFRGASLHHPEFREWWCDMVTKAADFLAETLEAVEAPPYPAMR